MSTKPYILRNDEPTLTPDQFSEQIIRSGEVTWSGGGTTLVHPVSSALPTDHVVATFKLFPTDSPAANKIGAGAGTGEVTFALDVANVANNAVIQYIVIRRNEGKSF